MKFLPVLFAALIAASFSTAAHAAPQTTAADAPTSPTKPAMKFPAAGELPEINNTAALGRIIKEHGSDLLVLNVWATFCPPCVAELPDFVEVSKTHPEKQVRFVGLSVDLLEEKPIAEKFLKDHKIPYANFLIYMDDQDFIKFMSDKWEGEFPGTFIYDKQGNKVAEFLRPVTREELQTAIDGALKKQGA
ncbi:hypothetical protein BH09SUM1_BH09SUM1_09860 [soil metagenome]